MGLILDRLGGSALLEKVWYIEWAPALPTPSLLPGCDSDVNSKLLLQHHFCCSSTIPVLAVALLSIMMGVNSLSETVSKLPMKFFLKISCLGHSYRKLTKTPPKQRLIPRLLWHPCMAILFFSSSAKQVAQIPPLSTFIQPAFIFHETLEIHFFFSTSPLVNVNIGKLNVSLPRLKMRMVSDV